ncbi:division/cell wall cluster transcriptional repressor MraZ [Asticcacaulis sp. EMRT-3]|uniref:division/cell wall cluster transcriptional repressor MraZ n=1 Tax=Asticcacaulis sp. EMRT-3 TaxID=3040349 RepID=UPI0024AF2884|nr:division/cell wall cluster transcriptional repressor MraZ [Asticcacaulis sp. EMRT-3]MDI7773755.1 division/cell wall cluster transcriptional repressor MraZ [Asticcacaulis sp. EMRT-3]
MFLSSHEKPLDAKRRLLVPQDFRAAALTAHDGVEPFEGLYCFAAIDAACIECGGAAFFAGYRDVINEYPKFSPTRKALEHRFYAAMQRLSFDTAGRITLPEALCERFGLSGNVLIAGLGESFQIWNPDAYKTFEAEQAALVGAAFARREDLF